MYAVRNGGGYGTRGDTVAHSQLVDSECFRYCGDDPLQWAQGILSVPELRSWKAVPESDMMNNVGVSMC